MCVIGECRCHISGDHYTAHGQGQAERDQRAQGEDWECRELASRSRKMRRWRRGGGGLCVYCIPGLYRGVGGEFPLKKCT